MSRDIYIGFLGLGVVASSVVNLLQEKQEILSHKFNCNLIIKKILVRDLNKQRNCTIDKALLTANPDDVLMDSQIDIVFELMGGINPTLQYVTKAIELGKHIITANKAMIATHGVQLFQFAKNKNVHIAFEAAVGGGIPIIKVLCNALILNKVTSITAILNGTSNYILTRMLQDKVTFEEALSCAQKNGYAEADPSNDLQGIDAAQKLCILSSIAFNAWVQFRDLYVEGIASISLVDLEYAQNLGYVIKHVAVAQRDCHHVRLAVFPALIEQSHRLAKTQGTQNGVLINSHPLGESFYAAAGAGGNETASAILADVCDVISGRSVYLAHEFYESENEYININISDIEWSYYLRIPGTIDQAALKYQARCCGISVAFVSAQQDATITLTYVATARCIDKFIGILQDKHQFSQNITKLRLLNSLTYKSSDVCLTAVL